MEKINTTEMGALAWIALVLVIIGALNWGLIGLFNFNLVTALLGPIPALERAVYALVGFAACYRIYVLAAKRL